MIFFSKERDGTEREWDSESLLDDMCACVCVSVGVCVCAREREREKRLGMGNTATEGRFDWWILRSKPMEKARERK